MTQHTCRNVTKTVTKDRTTHEQKTVRKCRECGLYLNGGDCKKGHLFDRGFCVRCGQCAVRKAEDIMRIRIPHVFYFTVRRDAAWFDGNRYQKGPLYLAWSILGWRGWWPSVEANYRKKASPKGERI